MEARKGAISVAAAPLISLSPSWPLSVFLGPLGLAPAKSLAQGHVDPFWQQRTNIPLSSRAGCLDRIGL